MNDSAISAFTGVVVRTGGFATAARLARVVAATALLAACTPTNEVNQCRGGENYNPTTGQCDAPCPTGQHYEPAQQACVPDDNSQVCGAGTVYDEASGQCVVAPTDTSDSPDAGGGGEDAGGFQDIAEDTGPTVAEDAGVQDIKIDGQCNPLVDPIDRRIGFPCDDHCQCDSQYCYDEAYMSPFRFCTKNCSSGAGSSCSDESNDPNEYVCLKFLSSHVNDYDLKVGGICMPRCGSDEQCKLYGPDYICPPNNQGTKWNGDGIQPNPTCQIPGQ